MSIQIFRDGPVNELSKAWIRTCKKVTLHIGTKPCWKRQTRRPSKCLLHVAFTTENVEQTSCRSFSQLFFSTTVFLRVSIPACLNEVHRKFMALANLCFLGYVSL